MRWIIPFLLLASPAWAEGFSVQISGDFTGDGVEDHAALMDFGHTGDADLLLKLGGGETLWVQDVVWVGGIGQQPSLTVTPHGSLQVMSHNSAIGRNRWEQIHTLAWRDGAMRIAGYTYRWYDTLNLDDIGSCDLNLLSGKGEVATGQEAVSRAISVSTPAYLVQNWPTDMPPECAALFD
ncbi:hypothetical protein [Aliiroseovarius marinus]|uniref:hypothetical protein n=1 Tax=Aliiroseovarius marinus TaxID=2500159 RepID=UPI0024957251|nr:hypothetical protein [Aliiroseovarius marinus]